MELERQCTEDQLYRKTSTHMMCESIHVMCEEVDTEQTHRTAAADTMLV